MLLDGPHGEPFGHDRLGQHLLVATVGGAQQGPGVAGGDLTLGQETLDTGRELE